MANKQAIESLKRALDESKIELIQVFSTDKYGPFQFLNEIDPSNKYEHDKFMKRFKDNIYAIAKPKIESIELVQLDDKKPLSILRPFRFLIGRMDISKSKTSFLAYIPKQYLHELKKAQTDDLKTKAKELSKASKTQNDFFNDFFNRLNEESQKVLDEYFSKTNLRELALNGNRKSNVPNEILETIRTSKVVSGDKKLPLGEYKCHEEEIELPNGRVKKISLIILTNFNGKNVKDYKEDYCHITEITENYSILYRLFSE